MGFGKLTKQELSTELYKDLKVELATTPADVEISGRTLVNLLGRAGNAIYKQEHLMPNQKPTFDGEYMVFNQPADDLGWSMIRYQRLELGKYYLGIFEYITDVEETCHIQYSSLTGKWGNNKQLNKLSYEYSACHITTLENQGNEVYFQFSCGNPSNIKIKNARLYEISEADYNKINEDAEYTGDKLIEKYPYVDDIKCVVNPYVECKENLLEDAQWVKGNYFADGSLNAGGAGIGTTLPIEANTTLSIKIEGEYENYSYDFYNCTGSGYEQSGSYTETSQTKTFSNKGIVAIRFTKDIAEDEPLILKSLQTGKTRVTLVKGSTPKSYDECHNSRIMLETKLYDGEKITRQNDGSYVKNSEWDEVSIDTVLPISINNSATGYKLTSKISTLPESVIGAESYLVRYDGNMVKYEASTDRTFEHWYVNAHISKDVVFILPNSLTGWGDSYTPTEEEIRAFFLGWRMSDNATGYYNGTGTKYWAKLWCGIGDRFSGSSAWNDTVCVMSPVTVCPTTMNDQGYTPYKIIYKKETPTLEEVKTHGSLVVKDGIDVKVGSGLVLGELDTPKLYGTQPHLNAYDSGAMGLNYKCDTALKVYQGSRVYPFVSGGGVTDARQILGNWWCYVDNFDDWTVDYMIRETDTVTSFLYTITLPQSTQEILERTIEELSNTNEKLSAENRELHNKIESLPQASNPNLLINGDFQVWQRGESFTSNGYSADRWDIHADGGMKLSKQPFGVRFETVTVGTWHNLTQYIELPQHLIGKTLTLSLKLNSPSTVKHMFYGYRDSNNTPNSMSGVFSDEVKDFWSWNIQIPNKDVKFLWVGFQTLEVVGAKLDIEYVKLEVGDKATPFVPRTYAEELAMCQRYYEKLKAVVQVSPKTNGDGKYYCSSIPMVEKRITPSVAPTNDGNFINVCIVPKENISTSAYENNSKMVQPLIALPTSVQYSDSVCIFWFDADAEIY